MKIEVVVDKDNTHFSYMFECDKVIDGMNSSELSGTGYPKLVLLKKRPKPENMTKEQAEAHYRDEFETIAVFNNWTYWLKLPDGAEKCVRCGRYRILNKTGLCSECCWHHIHSGN